MSALERRTWHTLGWPRAAALVVGRDGVPRVPVDFGNGEIFWLDDPAWVRELITALTAGANQLEALRGAAGPDLEPKTESTAVIDAIKDQPPRPPGPAAPSAPAAALESDVLVHPTPSQEAANA